MSYQYIKRIYGLDVKPGNLVEFTEDGRTGKVAHRKTDDHYVAVNFDDGDTGRCHPMSIKKLGY